MPAHGSLTVQLSNETNDGLADLAGRTHRPRDLIAAEAITDYVVRELATIEAIEQGLADSRAGRVVPHEDVMRDARAIIEASRADL